MKQFFLVLSLLACLKSRSQQYNLLLDRFQYDMIDQSMNQTGLNAHTGVKPYRMVEVKRVINPDTISGAATPDRKFYNRWIGRKLFTENFLQLDSTDFQVYVDPLFSLDVGKDMLTGTTTYTNSRGIQLFGNFGKKVSFYTSFWENQGRMVNYVDSFVQKNNVVPGQGRIKPFGKGGYDYAWASGYVSYSPSRYFNFQFGNDKNFIGDGYRSLFLSDNAFNYPQLKISTTFWKIKYTNLYVWHQNIGNASNSGIGGYKTKFASYQHLSINATKWLNIGLFEAVVFQGGDTTGARRGFDVNYLNPVIFLRPVEFSRGSPDNVLIGLNFKAMILKKYQLYGQLMLDDFSVKEVRAGNGWWGNKQGFQLGWKFFDFLGISNLVWQNELNYVRPYTFGHFTAEQSYTHFAQPLAHPLGANFIENLQFLRYRIKRIGLEAKFIYSVYGADTRFSADSVSNVGQNIFVGTSETGSGKTEVPFIYGNRTTQGLKNTVIFADLTASYLINVRTNMRVELTFSRRMQQNQFIEKNTNWVFFTFRTALPNRYYDF
jgi:hypothetical protein